MKCKLLNVMVRIPNHCTYFTLLRAVGSFENLGEGEKGAERVGMGVYLGRA